MNPTNLHSASREDVMSSPLYKGGNRDSEKCGDFPKITQQVNSRTELKLGLPFPNLVLTQAIRWHSGLFLVIVTASEVAKFPFCSSSPLMLSFKTKLGFTFRILKHRKVLSPMDVNQMCE